MPAEVTVTVIPGELDAYDEEWRIANGRDGITRDLTGNAFNCVPSGVAATVTIAPGTCLVDGFIVHNPTTITLDPTAIGTQPTGGQSRTDLVVARYDTSEAGLSDRAVIAIVPGTPSTTPSAPAETRITGGVWEVPLWFITRPAGGLVSAVGDRRFWIGDVSSVVSTSALGTRPLGHLAFRAGIGYLRIAADPGWEPVIRRPPLISRAAALEAPGGSVSLSAGATKAVAGAIVLGSRPYDYILHVNMSGRVIVSDAGGIVEFHTLVNSTLLSDASTSYNGRQLPRVVQVGVGQCSLAWTLDIPGGTAITLYPVATKSGGSGSATVTLHDRYTFTEAIRP